MGPTSHGKPGAPGGGRGGKNPVLGPEHGASFGNRVFADGINEGSGDEVILDQLCHPRHWARPPYWNMVKSHRTEGNGVFSKSCVTWNLRIGPHLEIGSLQMELGS
jgi:hypothetical protein